MFIFFCNVFYVWLSIRLIVVSCAAACVVLTVNGGMPHTVNAYYSNFDVVAHTHERLEWIFFRKTIHLFLLFRSIFFIFIILLLLFIDGVCSGICLSKHNFETY